MLICVNKRHRYKKIKNIKIKEDIFWRTRKKTVGGVIINTILNISWRPEGILPHLCKFYTASTECQDCYNLIDSLKDFRDFCFDSVDTLFQIFGPR